MSEAQGPFAVGCALCGRNIHESDEDEAYREVKSWVHGPKLQSPVLREQTGRMAHKECIEKAINGQAPDQESIPGLES